MDNNLEVVPSEEPKKKRGWQQKGPGRTSVVPKELVPLRQEARRRVEGNILKALSKIFNSHLAEATGTVLMLERTTSGITTSWSKVWNEERILKILQEKELGKDYILIKQGGDWKAADALMDRLLGKPAQLKREDGDEEDDPKSIFNQFNTFIQNKPVEVVSERTLKKLKAREEKK